MGIVQSTEGLTRTKRWRNEEFAVCAGLRASPAFGLGLTPSTFRFSEPHHQSPWVSSLRAAHLGSWILLVPFLWRTLTNTLAFCCSDLCHDCYSRGLRIPLCVPPPGILLKLLITEQIPTTPSSQLKHHLLSNRSLRCPPHPN